MEIRLAEANAALPQVIQLLELCRPPARVDDLIKSMHAWNSGDQKCYTYG